MRILDLFSGTCSKLLRLHDSRGVVALQAVRGPGGTDLLVRWVPRRPGWQSAGQAGYCPTLQCLALAAGP